MDSASLGIEISSITLKIKKSSLNLSAFHESVKLAASQSISSERTTSREQLFMHYASVSGRSLMLNDKNIDEHVKMIDVK